MREATVQDAIALTLRRIAESRTGILADDMFELTPSGQFSVSDEQVLAFTFTENPVYRWS